jgi:putative ABC transport system substrate-binding protein
MRRRAFIASLTGVVVWPVAGGAQQPGKLSRIAYFTGAAVASNKRRFACFKDGLRELGWIEGKNISIEDRWSDGTTEGFRGSRQN